MSDFLNYRSQKSFKFIFFFGGDKNATLGFGVSFSEREYLCNIAANDIMDSGSVTTDSLVKIMKAMAKTEIILDDGSSVKIIPKRRKVTYRLVSGLTQVESYKPLYLKKC